MIGAVAPAAVAVEPSRIAGEQFVDVPEKIPVGTRPGLEERYTSRAVGNEDRHEPISPGPDEGRYPVGDVERSWGSARLDPKGPGVHAS